MRIRKNKVLGGVLLIAGTTIGAGMLALPVVTGLAGFIPSIFLFTLYWAYMTFTAFLMLEVNLSVGENANLVTMAKRTLGRGGELTAWATYLFLLYLLTAAYLAGGGPIVSDCVYSLTGLHIPRWAAPLPLLLIFGYFVYEGTKYVDAVNRILMFCLAAAYVMMVFLVTPHVNPELLEYSNWAYIFPAVSLAATSFGYHIIIPTLATYMHRNVRDLRKAIFLGSLIPLAVYSLWEVIALGVVPVDGDRGVVQGYKEGIDGVKLLSGHLENSGISLVAQIFSFFAIITSFLGVTLSLTDFLADGLKIKKTFSGRALLILLTFLPPSLFILTNPRAFLSALEFAGAFGVVILLGLLPAMMAWSGRYKKNLPRVYTVPGGKPALAIVMVVSVLVVGIEIANKMGLFIK